MPVALEPAPVIELEVRIPGGGGPGGNGPDDFGGGGGGGDRDDSKRRVGLYRLAVGLTLISITSLFTTLVFTYLTRAHAAEYWPAIPTPKALWISTAVLALSSLYLEFGRRALAEGHWGAYRRRLTITSFLGMMFIASQLLALAQLVQSGVFVEGNPHASIFWIFTGAHGAHLLVGMLALIVLLFRRGSGSAQHRTFAGLVALYWHFMGLIWLMLFILLLAI